MTITAITDQDECREALTQLGILEHLKPKNGMPSVDGMAKISSSAWLIASNEAGQYRILLLQDCTEKEAWKTLEISQGQDGFKNTRIAITQPGGGEVKADNN